MSRSHVHKVNALICGLAVFPEPDAVAAEPSNSQVFDEIVPALYGQDTGSTPRGNVRIARHLVDIAD